MGKYLLTCLFLVVGLKQYAQVNTKTKAELGLGISILSSYTDIGGTIGSGQGIIDFKFSEQRPGINAFYKYNFSPRFSVKGTSKLGVFTNTDQDSRNESRGFEVNMPFLEVCAVGQYFILKEKTPFYYRSSIKRGQVWARNILPSLYVQMGLGVTFTMPIWNEKMASSTDSGLKRGAHFSPVLPLGLGITYPIGVDVRFFADFNYTFLLTDYLEGYSNTKFSKSNDIYFALNMGLVYQFGDKFYDWNRTKIRRR